VRITLKTKIWLTVLSVVMMFAFFILFYFPAQQEKYLLKNFNKEVQNLANTVALGVKIAITEQNFEGVQTAMDFVKGDPHLNFISMLQTDTLWNEAHTTFTLNKTVFKTYPDGKIIDVKQVSNDSILVKEAPFKTAMMSGSILLGFSKDEIVQSKKQIRFTSLLVSLIVFIVGILIGFWLARNISVPVLALRDAANKVGEGDLTQRVSNYSHDEIGELGQAFNRMVNDLEKAREEIKASNIALASTNNELQITVEHLKSTQAQLIQSEKMASLGQLTAGIAHEIQNPLNFVNNFSELSVELIEDFEAIETTEEDKKDIIKDIKSNLEKIAHHGKRADRIVKGMLMHSREQKGEKVPVRINQQLEEDTTIAYHGLRAKNSAFQCEIVKDFDTQIEKINIIPQDINRVVINLLNNAFYAVGERQHSNTDATWKPIVKISTKQLNSKVTIGIEDNGTGIPDDVKERIFNPFFTTKPTGEGTGLGLSICYDIIKSHGGEITVESEFGKGTKFNIVLII
jgi:two-component system NtrC family sensor kinase